MKIVVVSPHPDDLEIFCGGTVAEHVKRGDRVVEVLVTDGQRGSLGNMLLYFFGLAPQRSLGEKRRKEAVCSAAFLKIKLKPLGLMDRGLTPESGNLILSAVEEEHPELIYAPDPEFPSYQHPDHLITGRAVSNLRPIRFYHTKRPNARVEVDKRLKLQLLHFHQSQRLVWGCTLRRRIGPWEEFREAK